MPIYKQNSLAVIQRQSPFGKARVLALLFRSAKALVIAVILALLPLGYILESWPGFLITAACMMAGSTAYITFSWGLDRLALLAMRRGIRRMLGESQQQHEIDSSAWVITDDRYTILASAKRRKYYIFTGQKWHMMSSDALKQVDLVDRRSWVGSNSKWLLLSDEYAGRSIEFRIVDGHPDQLVAALKPLSR